MEERIDIDETSILLGEDYVIEIHVKGTVLYEPVDENWSA